MPRQNIIMKWIDLFLVGFNFMYKQRFFHFWWKDIFCIEFLGMSCCSSNDCQNQDHGDMIAIHFDFDFIIEHKDR